MQLLDSHVWRDHRLNPPGMFVMTVFGEIRHALELNLGI